MSIHFQKHGRVALITIDRPERRNAVDSHTALALFQAFQTFERSEDLDVAVLTGQGEYFCAGADLKALSEGDRKNLEVEGALAPMGPTRMRLSKPVIAAIEGYAVAGGLELALWCDLRVASKTASLGVFCRRFGVPLVDLGTIRLPRLIGHSRAMDLILTGREVDALEAERIGLVNRVVEKGQALSSALALAEQLVSLPQVCLRNDRLSALEQWDLSEEQATKNEMHYGLKTLRSGETHDGARHFALGAGRHGSQRQRGDHSADGE